MCPKGEKEEREGICIGCGDIASDGIRPCAWGILATREASMEILHPHRLMYQIHWKVRYRTGQLFFFFLGSHTQQPRHTQGRRRRDKGKEKKIKEKKEDWPRGRGRGTELKEKGKKSRSRSVYIQEQETGTESPMVPLPCPISTWTLTEQTLIDEAYLVSTADGG